MTTRSAVMHPLALVLFFHAIVRLDLVMTLSVDFYESTCPNVENLVLEAVQTATNVDNTVPAGILRMHFHDCFIEGCDGSILIDSTSNNTAEKDAPPNVSLHGFSVIDNAKANIEAACPNVVSCADILTIAARDAVVLSGGPSWVVLKGRMDGKVSNASETRGLPAPTFNVSQLIQTFALRNLSQLDMVTLSGGHTLGFSHCSSFNKRLFRFSSTSDIDPTMSLSFANTLRAVCPNNNTNNRAGTFLDDTRTIFDNQYYINLVEGKGVFSSDQNLYMDPQTSGTVKGYAASKEDFFANFGRSMVKMGNVGIKTKSEGEIRVNCRAVNEV